MTSRAVVYEVATLARHFKAEIILLHIVTPPGHLPGMPIHGHELTERDWHVAAARARPTARGRFIPYCWVNGGEGMKRRRSSRYSRIYMLLRMWSSTTETCVSG